jgi:hypothetical protein
MTQVLRTLDKIETSRFEAFRKSALPSNAIRDYLAHLLLLHQHDHLAARCRNTTGLLVGNATTIATSTTTNGSPANSSGGITSGQLGTGMPHLEHAMMKVMTQSCKDRRRPLHDLVQPNEADSIVVVVSALAKAYAQRLVTAARRVANVMQEDELTVSHENGNDGATTPHNRRRMPLRRQQKALKAHHIQLAHDARVKAGLDPGFFLQRQAPSGSSTTTHSRGMAAPTASWPCPGKIAAAALGQVDRHELLRQAALQAQEDYDQCRQVDGDGDGGVSEKSVVEDTTTEDESHVATASVQNPDAVVIEPAAVEDVEMIVEQPDSSTARAMDVEPQHEEQITTQPTEAKPLSSSIDDVEMIPMEMDAELPAALPAVVVTTTTTTANDTPPKVETPLTNATIPLSAANANPESTTPAAPAAPPKSEVPLSMEDALLLNLDDDSDDDDDDDED